MTMYKNVNGVDVALSPEEEAEFNQRLADFESAQMERTKQMFVAALVSFIDETAQDKGYNDAISCVSYVQSTNEEWALESSTFIAWRDAAYIYAYDYLAQCESGAIANPTLEAFLSGIAPIIWPIFNP